MKTAKISVKDVTNSTLSKSDGVQLQSAIDSELVSDDMVYLSFHDVHTISSSFLNSSLGDIIDKYGLNILSKIKIVDYTASVASFLKNYVSDLKSLSTN
jgi:hypothetical protein